MDCNRRGRYVANLDHDDIAMPTRLEQQIAYLEQHPTIGAVDGLLLVIDQTGNLHPDSSKENAARVFPATPGAVRWAANFLPTLPRCTLTVRREVMERVGGYSPRYAYICDYDIEVRLAEHVDMANVYEVLATRLKSVVRANRDIAPEECAPILARITELRELAMRVA